MTVTEWKRFLVNCYEKKGRVRGHKYISNLFASFERRYVVYVNNMYHEAMENGEKEETDRLQALCEQEQAAMKAAEGAMKSQAREQACNEIMAVSEAIFDKLSLISLSSVNEGTLTKDELIKAMGGDFGETISIIRKDWVVHLGRVDDLFFT